jgi:hypothetical protein
VVPKNLEKEWLETYTTIGADIAAYNNPDWASGIKMKLEEGKVGREGGRARRKSG